MKQSERPVADELIFSAEAMPTMVTVGDNMKPREAFGGVKTVSRTVSGEVGDLTTRRSCAVSCNRLCSLTALAPIFSQTNWS